MKYDTDIMVVPSTKAMCDKNLNPSLQLNVVLKKESITYGFQTSYYSTITHNLRIQFQIVLHSHYHPRGFRSLQHAAFDIANFSVSEVYGTSSRSHCF